MGLLSTAKAATFTGPTRLALHSVEGFGKTTLAAFFPSPLFVCAERGFPRDLGRAPQFVQPTTWEEVRSLIQELMTGAHQYESLVFDTMDWVEPLIWKFVCARDTNRKTEMNPKGHTLESIEDYGYGKGYLATMEEMRALLSDLDQLQTKRGMHIVILIHSHVKPFNNPAGDNFDRWQPKLHDRCARLIVEWCENVFFGYFEITTAKQDASNKREKAKGASTGRRILGTRHNAMYDAKNRFNLPDTVELGNPAELMPYLLGKHITPPKSADAAMPNGKPAEQRAAASDATKTSETFKETNDKIAGAYADAMTDDVKRAQAMLADVERACGAKVRREVEKWLAVADTPDKVAWCFAEAAKKIQTATAAAASSKPTTADKEEKIAARYE